MPELLADLYIALQVIGTAVVLQLQGVEPRPGGSCLVH